MPDRTPIFIAMRVKGAAPDAKAFLGSRARLPHPDAARLEIARKVSVK